MNKSQLASCVRQTTYWRKLTWLLLLGFTAFNLNAQTVTIGTGTLVASGTNGTPIYRSSTTSSFHHSKSIQLLTAAQLSAAGITNGATITEWGYNKTNNGAPAGANAWTLNVYLKNTSATGLLSGTSWNTMISGATLAYTATINSANMPSAIGYWMWPTSPFTYTGGSIEAYIEWFPAGPLVSPFSTNSFQWQYTSSGSQAMGTSSGSVIAGTNTAYTTQTRFYNTRITYLPPVPCSGTPNTPALSPSSYVAKCQNQTQSMTATGASIGLGLSHQWEISSSGGGSGFTPIAGATSTSYTTPVLAPGAYFYRMVTTCSFSSLTSNSDELLVEVFELPSVTVSPSSASICGGGSQQFVASGANTYAWSPTTGLTPTSGATVNASPSASTSYIVTGTDANGCTGTAAALLTVNQGVSLSGIVASPANVCELGSTSLQANVSFVSPPYCIPVYTSANTSGDYCAAVVIPGTTLNNNHLQAAALPNYNLFPATGSTTATLMAGTTYTITLTPGTFSSNDFAAWIDYNQNGLLENPVEKLGQIFNIPAGPASTSFVFSVPPTAFNGNTRLRVREADQSGTDLNACTGYTFGETEDYTITISGGVDPFAYSWSETPANATLASNSGNPVAANLIASTTTYSVTATSTNGCSTSGSITIVIDPLACQTPTVPAAICSGQNFSITANHTGGGAPFSYSWDDGAAGVYPNAASITANLAAGAYTFTVTVSDACGESCSSAVSFTVEQSPSGVANGPAAAVTYQNLVYTLTGANPTDSYQWQFATNASGPWTNIGTNDDSLTTVASSAGTFYIQCLLTNLAGCTSPSNSITTVVTVAGDNPCDAITLSPGMNGPFTNSGATTLVGEPAPPAIGCNVQNGWCLFGISHSVWFKFVAPAGGRIVINTGAPLWDNQLALYQVGLCGDFSTYTLLAANDDGGDGSFAAKINSLCLVPGQTYYVQLDGYQTTTNGNFFINLIQEAAALKAMLSGPYDAGTGLMHDILRSMGQVPLNEPYSNPPYNRTPIGGPAGEFTTPAVLAVTGNNAIVDWVMLEFRDAANSSVVVANKRALIQRDGDIVNHADGVSPVAVPGLASGNYYISVKHRNHLGVMSATTVATSECNAGSFNFTNGALWVKAGEIHAPARMYGSVAALWSSDANFNKNAKYNGLNNDKLAVLNALGGINFANNVLSPVYRAEDLNLDGQVKYNNTDNDRNVIANTVGVSTPNAIINQHTPN